MALFGLSCLLAGPSHTRRRMTVVCLNVIRNCCEEAVGRCVRGGAGDGDMRARTRCATLVLEK
jgi:hypothetical protein